jgi:biopolymer transport protein TolR
MARRRNRNNATFTADINVTSLVDLAFTLLVIFIIAAPIMQGGVEVSVPRARAESLDSGEGIIVSVNRDGELFIGDAQATWEEFEPALVDAVRAKQADAIFLRADEQVDYGRVLQVLGAMRALDIASVGLVAEPENQRGGGGGGR